ncbi:Flavodoxin-1 [Phocoenobacter uteri]|uniref:Flavodoxin n=1 Tax=Phocoenobacter uteri TaxID=146806 RepID=A0A379C931_9PAST|nr:flavodoxin FldA [Phocoenobacter uteri]MDG6882648.1 flavodoxin FldA [Phocoenobacter uteri]SUB58813.1 Flavodoxin-1 [Phocoenobacter uteri]
MAAVGLFYGSDTGNTEAVSKMIQDQLGANLIDVHDIAKSTKEDIEAYDFLLIGIPTWYYGESQADWDDFMPTLQEIDFTGKIIGIFGCGDQEDYAEYFCDAMGTVRDVVEQNGGIIVGHWSTEGYSFEVSQALVDENTFVGLCIDEDRQPELTEQRVQKWCEQLKDEMCLSALA